MNQASDPYFSPDGEKRIVRCIVCGGGMLHHVRADIYQELDGARPRLPDIHVVVEGFQATIDTDMKGNPSARRNGIAIKLGCEECRSMSVMTIVQHKGQTFLRIEPSDEAWDGFDESIC